jgi:tetratricopeptide (TPR) repeat protein
MKIAWRLIALVLVAGAIASWAAGFYLLRNPVADQLSAVLAARADALTTPQAGALERKLQTDPNNFAYRIELLNYYSSRSITDSLTPAELANRRQHILWTIQHEPASKFAGGSAASFLAGSESADPEGAQKAGNLWLQQADAHPSNAHVLYNAGEFFFWSGNWQQSESLLERAHAIKPDSFEISSALFGDYWHDANSAATDNERRDLAVRAMNASEDALDLAHGADQRRLVLPDGAQAAYEAGAFVRAELWASEMLDDASGHQDNPDFSDEIHYGNIVLGRVALQKGDAKTAGNDLVQAAAIVGNPHLDTFGPNMMLARELIRKGDRKPVVEYLDSCGKFWKTGDKKLQRWRAEVKVGVTPDFGANLRY